MARYVGFKIGKVHEEHVFSEYYCGGCGFPVTDHDSFCPECGGAFRESDADDDENANLRELALDMLRDIHGCNYHHSCGSCNFDECIYESRMRELGIEVTP